MNRFIAEVDGVPFGTWRVSGSRPDILVRTGERDRLIAEAIVALRDGGRVFQVGGLPAIVGHGKMPTLDGERQLLRRVLLVRPTMLTELVRAARWVGVGPKGRQTSREPPSGIAEHLLAQRVDLGLPALTGVVTAPQLRRDGAIIGPGYDAATGLFYSDCGVNFPEVPPRPTKNDARTALDRLAHPLRAFAFVDRESRSVALAALLTPFVRRSFSAAPGFAYSSPVAGSGKTMLAKISSLLATGESPAAISPGSGHEELEKRIGAALLSGRPYVTLDNIEDDNWGVPLLCTALTEEVVLIRVLGSSTLVEVQNVATIAATGNNLVIPGDLTRRFILCRLDPGVERPELKLFDFNPCDEVLQDRPNLVRDALTVLRAHLQAGQPRAEGVVPLGSFEDWCAHVRDPLVWLGEADPVASMATVRDNDPSRTTLDAFMQCWAHLGPQACGRLSASQLIALGGSNETWRTVLSSVASKGNGELCALRLGRWMKRNKERIVNGRRIVAGALNGSAVYQLQVPVSGQVGLGGDSSPTFPTRIE